jgi:hypothetical protein
MTRKLGFRLISTLALGALLAASQTIVAQTSDSGQPAIAKRIGTIKTIDGSSLTLAASTGPEVSVTVQPSARILRLAPGETDLKKATPLQLGELQTGDTVRVRGTTSDDGKTFSALEVIVITHAAVAAAGDQLRQDWQKRGMGGRVESVDSATGDVKITIPSLTSKKNVVIHTTKNTLVHRYSPNSAKPEDAKPSTLEGIRSGDQLRARGERNADASELTAEEIYVGVFPEFAGTVKSVDASSGILTVQDLVTKKAVQVKVTADSQLHKIFAEMAQMFAMGIKRATQGTPATGQGTATSTAQPAGSPTGPPPNPQSDSHANGQAWSRGGGGTRQGGPFDFQRMLSRMPSSTLADMNLQKGDAVMILSTEGSPASPGTAITLLSGVEPILQAAPSASQAMMLTPWTLGGTPGGDASQ